MARSRPKTKRKRTTRRSQKKTNRAVRLLRQWLTVICVTALISGIYYLIYVRPAEQRQRAIPGRPVMNDVELQIALARKGFSPGSIDGHLGQQTRQALSAYQASNNLSISGIFDAESQEQLKIQDPVFTQRPITRADFSQIGPRPKTWRARGQLDRMRYNSLLEMIAEQSQSDPDYIAAINPNTDWNRIHPGDYVQVPRIPAHQIGANAERIQISLSKRILQVLSPDGRILFHSPVSIARKAEKRPQGQLFIKVRVENPNYTFNPAILSSAAAREGITQKFIIQPGPNNPVGNVWIGLNLPSYGIHGTPTPEQVGRTESSGCFRLANWNAQALLHASRVGMPVYVTP